GDPSLLRSFGREGQKASAELGARHQRPGQVDVADVGDQAHRPEPARIAGTARDEYELAVAQRRRPPFQPGRRRRRSTVFVEAQESDVEGVAGEVEIVRVAAEGSGSSLGGESEADVGVAAILVEGVEAAAIEWHDLAILAGGFVAAARFDILDRGVP